MTKGRVPRTLSSALQGGTGAEPCAGGTAVLQTAPPPAPCIPSQIRAHTSTPMAPAFPAPTQWAAPYLWEAMASVSPYRLCRL